MVPIQYFDSLKNDSMLSLIGLIAPCSTDASGSGVREDELSALRIFFMEDITNALIMYNYYPILQYGSSDIFEKIGL